MAKIGETWTLQQYNFIHYFIHVEFITFTSDKGILVNFMTY